MNCRDSGPVAVIDCGTNSTRLLIAHSTGSEVVRETRITRLGQGVDQAGLLAPEAIARTLVTLRDYRMTMRQVRARRGRMVATSAVRDARNGSEFLRGAAAVVGLEPELLSGEEEGRLAFEGAIADLDNIDGDDVVVDIGGGSTELVVRRDGALGVVSLDIGSVRLTERCLLADPPNENEITNAVITIRRQLKNAESSLPALASPRTGSRMIGLAGTVTTVAALVLGLVEYRRDAVHHATLPFDAVANWSAVLLSESAGQRTRRLAIPQGRADVIAGGALILREVMSWLGMPQCITSEADLLDGLVRSVVTG